jgi:Methyltransferase domain
VNTKRFLKIINSAAKSIVFRSKHKCVFCDEKFTFFLPYRNGWADVPELHKCIGIIGSDVNNFSCLNCKSTDRERHLRLYFEATGQNEQVCGSRILHFAPERKFTPWLASYGPAEHVLADLYPTSPAVQKIDLLALPFDAGHFDMVIVNHVLEHVDDDIKALSEILRVLKPGGVAVLQTPYCEGIAAKIEDSTVTNPEARLQLYGQEDHVRLYGSDFREFICTQGFEDASVTHAEVLKDVPAKRYGVNASEPFLRFRKPLG